MNRDTFLKFLQSLITMTDANDPASIASAKAIIIKLNGLIRSSGMANGQVMMMADNAEHIFENLIAYKEDFAGKPGDVRKNKAKRDRLEMTLFPHC